MSERIAAAPVGLSADVERLAASSVSWSPTRVMDEGLDLIRDATWADVVRLHAIDDHGAVAIAARPAGGAAGGTRTVPLDWFPWGLAPVSPRRFLLVSQAEGLPSGPGGPTLGADGVRSCLHLPILERQQVIGALHLHWAEPRVAWDDERGRLLRLLGRFLLGRPTS